MSRGDRNGKNARGATSESVGRKAARPLPFEMTTESLAGAVESELSTIESQLQRLSAPADDTRPYESFDLNSCPVASDHAPAFFEYDGHCPPRAPENTRVQALRSRSWGQTDPIAIDEAEAAAPVNRVATSAPQGADGHTVPQLTDDLQNTFQQLGRHFSSSAAQQWREANERLNEVRSRTAEIRRLHAAARDLLGEIEQLRAAAGRACGSNPNPLA